MGYDELRNGRVSIGGQTYLLTAVTANREPLFTDLYLARLVITQLRQLDDAGATKTIAFVVMPDHLHWLCELQEAWKLQSIMMRLKGGSARKINLHRCSRRIVWQAAYHDHALRKDEASIEVARYIAMNPIRAGLVQKVGDYPHWDVLWDVPELVGTFA